MSDKQKLENERWKNQEQYLEFWHQETLKRITSGRVLDIGCGDGLLQTELAKKGVEDTIGVDVSESGIAKVKAKGFTAYFGDTTDIPSITELRGLQFDHAAILEVLEHVFNPSDMLKGARTILKDDGHLYASTPNFNAIGDRLRVLRGAVPWQKKHGKGHVYWMNVQVFKDLITDAGFDIVEFRSLGYRRGKSFASVFDWLAQAWPTMFALSFFVHANPRKNV
ncbi:MAG: class I SAM-dependent methyltransferase [Candidatus Pacebacteria bacterium]|nr:class I SAM-dependent methyltransferase [Candidatus Paceibacterota bacterium]